MPRARAQAQLALDESHVQDAELEEALEERARRKASLDALRLEYKAADDRAKARLEEHDGLIEPEHPIRVGRWRITRVVRAGRTVHFETKPSTSIRIEDASEEEEAPKLRAVD